MELSNEQEFWMSFVLIGGITLAGVLISLALAAFSIVVWRKLKDKKIEQKLYEQERKNGKPTDRRNI